LCTELDDLVTSIGKPLVIWGASIGPFTKDAAYEKYIMEHFRKVHIFARESLTIDYLNRNGLVGNVHKTADPAFMMEPRKPCSGTMEIPPDNGAIGINISPLMARYTPDRNLDTWVGMSAGIVEAIIRKTKRDIYLIPHVSSSNGRNNDHTFLCKVAFLLGRKKARVFVVPDTLDASETKWVISKMDLFVGARMHSTIASFSSYVPTLSLGYSVKSWGINRDIYGHTEYCLDIGTLTPDVVADKVSEMLSDSRSIEDLLKATIPRIKEYALSAGSILGKILHM
jgi:colanic acid/amylovoran biosynthesis protein